MKKTFYLLLATVFVCHAVSRAQNNIDMQAHIGTDEALGVYTKYIDRQNSYYQGDNSITELRKKSGNELFGALNTIMGTTNNIYKSSFSYDALRDNYRKVDKDLNKTSDDYPIIGFYDGQSFNGVWDNGLTWNREHVWPQSKGASKTSEMGYDMHAVRPALVEQNSDRGSKAYGLIAHGKYYDPDSIPISNPFYVKSNLGSYHGDAARIILYDYVVYGKVGDYKNNRYNGKAQLLSKTGTSGVFESIPVLLAWHMNDPVSLTEMVRNDGAQLYQGNRNPFIDFPELAILMLKNTSGLTTYSVSVTGADMWPAYTLTLADGFIAYLGSPEERPQNATVTGATSSYDPQNGRLIVSKVKGNVTIDAPTTQGIEEIRANENCEGRKILYNGQILIIRGGKMYNIMGQEL